MQTENLLKALEAVQQAMNSEAQKHVDNYDMYLIAKAVAELAFLMRLYVIEKGGALS
jgi:hypothetical protein